MRTLDPHRPFSRAYAVYRSSWNNARLFADGTPGLTGRAAGGLLFSDAAGTVPSGYGANQVARANSPVPGQTHLAQTLAASRLARGRRPAGGVRNLLTYSEDLTNAVWEKSGAAVIANAAAAPDGTLAADRLVGNAGAGVPLVVQTLSFSAGVHTFSTYFKSDGVTMPRLSLGPEFGSPNVVFDLSTGVASAGGQMEAVGDGWWRCSLSAIAIAAATRQFQIRTGSAGDGVSGLLIWGAQLEAGDLSAYQRVTSSYDVTEAGQPVVEYVQTDGLDDFLVSPVALDLSAATGATLMVAAEALPGAADGRFLTHGRATAKLEIRRNLTDRWTGAFEEASERAVVSGSTPNPAVVEWSVARSGLAELFVNGVSQGTIAIGTQIFDNDVISLGALWNGSGPAPARFFEWLVRPGQLTPEQRLRATAAMRRTINGVS